MSDIIFGTAPTESKVVDTTASQYEALRNPIANTLRNQFQNPNAYQGPYAAQLGGAEQQALRNIQGAAGQVGVQQPIGMGQINPMGQIGQNTGINGGSYPTMSPGLQFSGSPQQFIQQGQTPQQILAGSYGQNPYANLSGLEQQGVNTATQQAYNQSPNLQLAQQILGQQIGGQQNPFASAAGLSSAEQGGLNSIQQTAFGANPLQNTVNQQLGAIAGTGVHPQLQQLIQTAQQPILDQFSEDALAQRGLYTGAGQQIQGQGSSPFAHASAKLSGNVANALGNTATNVTAQLNAQQQQAQLAALGMAQQQPGLQLQNQLAGQAALGLPREVQQLGLNLQNQAFQQNQAQQLAASGLSDQLSGNALTRALQGLGAAGVGQERQGAAFENSQNRQLQAGGQLGQQQLAGQQAQLQAQLSNLQAQGLPRLIEQLGIEGGMQEFQRQQQQLMSLLGLGGQLSSGQQVLIPGAAGTPGLAQSFVGGLGAGIGGNIFGG